MADHLLRDWRDAVAQDLRLLALLHGREATAGLLAELKRFAFPDNLGLRLRSPDGRECCAFMAKAVQRLPDTPEQRELDELSADFAAIYLTHRLRASPYESVWLGEDGLMRQGPMFEVRKWYQRYRLQMADWRSYPDDHLAAQLQFVAHLCALQDDDGAALRDAAQFMDEHLLRWIKLFAARVSQHAATDYFSGVALLTAAYVDELRELLAELLDYPRPPPQPADPPP